MRKIILGTICLILVSVAFAHSADPFIIPAKVRTYVEKHYPKAGSVDWDFDEEENVYEAEFKRNGLEYELKLTSEGVLKYSKEDVRISNLPAPVLHYVQKEYKGYKILGANKLFIQGKYLYDVGIKGKDASGHTRYFNLYFDGKGNVVPNAPRTP